MKQKTRSAMSLSQFHIIKFSAMIAQKINKEVLRFMLMIQYLSL